MDEDHMPGQCSGPIISGTDLIFFTLSNDCLTVGPICSVIIPFIVSCSTTYLSFFCDTLQITQLEKTQ